MQTSEFNPIRTISVTEFKSHLASQGVIKANEELALFPSSAGGLYIGVNGRPQDGSVCFLSKKIQATSEVTKPVVSEIQATDEATGTPIEGKTVYVFHNQGEREAIMTF